MADAGVDHLIAYGASGRGGPVYWLSDWLPTWEAVLVFSPGDKDTLFVQYYNHLPQARRIMTQADVQWGGASTIQSVLDELARRGAKPRRVGFAGPLPVAYYKTLTAAYDDVADFNRSYFQLRLVKSPEEIDRFRIGARLSDASIAALRATLRPGLTERDLGAIAESAFMPWGGINVIHFFGVTSMREPRIGVPCQHPANRPIAKGDAISCELSANYFDYGGQVLRTFSVGEPLTPLYRDLHDAAQAAFDAIVTVLRPGCHARDIVAASGVIEAAGFTTYDDVVHGYGGGYLPPVLGSPSRQNEAIPDMRLAAGMMVVVQPNVITKDERAGVQLGECMLITETGAESLHMTPRGPFLIEA